MGWAPRSWSRLSANGCSMPNMIDTSISGTDPRSHPLASPFLCTLFNGGGNRGLLDYQGRAGIISIVRWNLRPVILCRDVRSISFCFCCDPMCHRNCLGPNWRCSNESIYELLERWWCGQTLRSKLGDIANWDIWSAIESAELHKCLRWESLDGGLANGGLRYLSTAVHDWL